MDVCHMLANIEKRRGIKNESYWNRCWKRKCMATLKNDKGSNDKINVFITLLYPRNNIKFNASKTRNNVDIIDHLNRIKRYVRERSINRFILVIDNV